MRGRSKLDHYAINRFPLTIESAMKKKEDSNMLVSIVDIKASKQQIKQAVKKLCDIDVAKANTQIRPDRQKAYVCLAPHCDALDVAKKIGIICTEENWLILSMHLFHQLNKQKKEITKHGIK